MDVVLEQGVVVAAALELHLAPFHVGGENAPALVLNRVLYAHSFDTHCEMSLPVGSGNSCRSNTPISDLRRAYSILLLYSLVVVGPRAES